MSTTFSDEVRAFLDAHGDATVATIDPDGAPHHALVWYLRDGDEIVLNSAVGRRWPANLVRDGRVSVVVSDGGSWVGLRGTVQVIDDPVVALGDITAMAERYDPANLEARKTFFATQTRITFRLSPDRVHAEI